MLNQNQSLRAFLEETLKAIKAFSEWDFCSKDPFLNSLGYLTMKEIMCLISGASHNFRKVLMSETESQQTKDPFISFCSFIQATSPTYAQILFSWTVFILMRWSLCQVRMLSDCQQRAAEWDKTCKTHSVKKEMCVKHFSQLAISENKKEAI